jgi:hypothetical protein
MGCEARVRAPNEVVTFHVERFPSRTPSSHDGLPLGWHSLGWLYQSASRGAQELDRYGSRRA